MSRIAAPRAAGGSREAGLGPKPDRDRSSGAGSLRESGPLRRSGAALPLRAGPAPHTVSLVSSGSARYGVGELLSPSRPPLLRAWGGECRGRAGVLLSGRLPGGAAGARDSLGRPRPCHPAERVSSPGPAAGGLGEGGGSSGRSRSPPMGSRSPGLREAEALPDYGSCACPAYARRLWESAGERALWRHDWSCLVSLGRLPGPQGRGGWWVAVASGPGTARSR